MGDRRLRFLDPGEAEVHVEVAYEPRDEHPALPELEGEPILVAERQFRKVIGFRQIPLLLSSMANLASKKPIAKQVAVA